MDILLRWSFWGSPSDTAISMLRDSVLSFRRYFGSSGDYLVFTDRPSLLEAKISSIARVLTFDSVPSRTFNWVGVTPWKKWAPTARLSPGKPEVLIDSDVFCVGKPTELISFLEAGGDAVCGLQESVPEWWCYGAFRSQLALALPRINAGLFAQQSRANIHNRLEELYSWWLSSTTESERTAHDEQGAIAVIAHELELRHRAVLLPLDRYLILSPRSNSGVTSLDGLAIVHTTFPDHPYYHRFRHQITARGADERD
jgi:hypothetical protein